MSEITSLDGWISSFKWWKRGLCLNFLPTSLTFQYLGRELLREIDPSALGNGCLPHGYVPL